MTTEKPKVHVYDCITGEQTTRDMTAEEIAAQEATDEAPLAD
jgi:hypothetical protein